MAKKSKPNDTVDTTEQKQATLATLQEQIRQENDLRGEGKRLVEDGKEKIRQADRVALDVGDSKAALRRLGVDLPRSHEDVLKLTVA